MAKLNRRQNAQLKAFVKRQYKKKWNPPKNATVLQQRIKDSNLDPQIKNISIQSVRSYIPPSGKAASSGAGQTRSTASNPKSLVPKKGETVKQAAQRTGKSHATISRAVAKVKKASGPKKTGNYQEL